MAMWLRLRARAGGIIPATRMITGINHESSVTARPRPRPPSESDSDGLRVRLPPVTVPFRLPRGPNLNHQV